MTLDTPLILTTKDHRICHERWHRFKREFPEMVAMAHRWFAVAEASVRMFGPHLSDVWWIDCHKLHEDAYGSMEPVDCLLESLHFPPHSEVVDRGKYIDSVKKLILEHELYGSDGNYMPRSVVLGWVCRQHDLLLGDLGEAA